MHLYSQLKKHADELRPERVGCRQQASHRPESVDFWSRLADRRLQPQGGRSPMDRAPMKLRQKLTKTSSFQNPSSCLPMSFSACLYRVWSRLWFAFSSNRFQTKPGRTA